MAKTLLKMLTGQLVAGVLVCSGFLPQVSSAQATNAQPLSGLTVNHVTLSVENLDREAGWYERVLGFKVTGRSDSNPDFLSRQLRIPGYRIDLIKYKGSTRAAPVYPLYLRQGWIHIAFDVPNLPAALADLRALNTDVTADNADNKAALSRLVVHDPEGNEIEFFSRK